MEHVRGASGVLWFPISMNTPRPYHTCGQNSIDGMSNSPRAWRSGARMPVDNKKFYLLHTSPDRPWDPPSLLYNGYGRYFPGLKRPGRTVFNPPALPPRLKISPETSTLNLCLYGMLQEDLYLYITTSRSLTFRMQILCASNTAVT